MLFVKKQWGFITVIILSIFSILPFFHAGFFPMHDDTQVTRIFEMGKSLGDGMFPVRWVSNLGYGYGYPIFNFYSPLPYYIGGFLTLFGLNALLATKIVFILGIILSGIFMYLFMKNFFGQISALCASIVYVYFPYHAVNIYVRGDLDELFAYAFLPLLMLGFYKIFYNLQKESWKKNLNWTILTGASFALIILSHNLSAFMVILILPILTFFALVFSKNRLSLIVGIALSLIIGFSISSFYWIPAISEMKFTNVYSQVGGGADFQDHFVCISQFWNSYWGFGGSTKGCLDGMSFKLGKFNIFLLFMSFIIFIYTLTIKKEKNYMFLYLSSFVLFLLSIFLMLNYSTFIWKTVPFMEFFQYPWRFLNFTGLFLSIVIGYFVFQIGKVFSLKSAQIASLLIIFATLFFNVKLFTPKEFLVRGSNYYANRDYVNWTVSKMSDEYMLKNFQKPMKDSEVPRDKIEIVKGAGSVLVLENRTGEKKFELNLKSDSLIKINIAYFPAWRITVNGKEKNPKIGANGLLLNIPSGKNTIETSFIQTPVEKLSNIVSLISILIVLVAIISHNFKKYGKNS